VASAAAAVRVQRVVLAGEAHLQLRPQCARAPNLPARQAALVAQVPDAPLCALAESVTLDAAQRVLHAFAHVRVAVKGHNQAPARHQVHQPLEGRLHCFQIRVNVGVVELHVGQNQRVGKIMQELRSLVEEGRIVFVALHDEGARGPELET